MHFSQAIVYCSIHRKGLIHYTMSWLPTGNIIDRQIILIDPDEATILNFAWGFKLITYAGHGP